MSHPESLNKPTLDELLSGAHAQYREMLARYGNLDRRIAAEVPGWAQDDRFVPMLVDLCLDTALLMLGADRQFNEVELQAVNSIFGINERPANLRDVAMRMQENRPGPVEYFSHLDRFFQALSVAQQLPDQDLVEPASHFILSLAQVVALIDDQYHPQERAFHQQLTERLRPPASLPPGTTLMLRLDDGRRQPWPLA